MANSDAQTGQPSIPPMTSRSSTRSNAATSADGGWSAGQRSASMISMYKSAECGVRSAECGVRSAECGVQRAALLRTGQAKLVDVDVGGLDQCEFDGGGHGLRLQHVATRGEAGTVVGIDLVPETGV